MRSRILDDIVRQQQSPILSVVSQPPGSAVARTGAAVAKAAAPQSNTQSLPGSSSPLNLSGLLGGRELRETNRDAYDSAVRKGYESRSATDLAALQRDLDRLSPTSAGIINDEVSRSIEELAAKYGVSLNIGDNLYDKAGELEEILNARISEAVKSQREQEYAKQSAYYSSLTQNGDFAVNSKPATGNVVSPLSASDYDYINNLVELDYSAPYMNAGSAFSASAASRANKSYDYLTDDERAVYNYLYNTQGEESAQGFIDFIDEALNYRYGQKLAGDVRDSLVEQYVFGFGAGLDRFGGGIKQLFSKDALPTSPMQFAGAQIREDLSETGPTIFGSSLGALGYDAFSTVGNMAPSILVSAISGGLGAPGMLANGLGAASMGASVSGNAYNQALAEGKPPEEARAYAALVGAAEAGLQFLIGGIGKLGGISDDILLKKVNGINNAIGRVAATGGVKIGSEVLEENLQNYIEPALRTLIFNEEYKATTFEEIAYTTLLTALTTGLMESGDTARTGKTDTSGLSPVASQGNVPSVAGRAGMPTIYEIVASAYFDSRFRNVQQNAVPIVEEGAVPAALNNSPMFKGETKSSLVSDYIAAINSFRQEATIADLSALYDQNVPFSNPQAANSSSDLNTTEIGGITEIEGKGKTTISDWTGKTGELAETSPVKIPENATVKASTKVAGYDQISYKWTEGGYTFEARWHTKTPGAPAGQGNTWVVSRVTPGTPTGQMRLEHILAGDKWVSRFEWQSAINAYQNGTITTAQEALLKAGHWLAP